VTSPIDINEHTELGVLTEILRMEVVRGWGQTISYSDLVGGMMPNRSLLSFLRRRLRFRNVGIDVATAEHWRGDHVDIDVEIELAVLPHLPASVEAFHGVVISIRMPTIAVPAKEVSR
jgi:hypothetical protein